MNDLLNITTSLIINKGCKVTYEVDQDKAHIFQIVTSDVVICVLVIYITENIIIYKNKEVELPVFNVNWIKTTNKFGGQGFATMLLIYGICYLKCQYQEIKYAKLDDASDNSNSMQHNLYNKIGFEFQEKPTIDPSNKDKLCIKSPEKQLLINSRFKKLALKALKL